MSNRLLLLDLDGTVRATKSGATFINDPCDQQIIPEAQNAIARYSSLGWAIVGITNQASVAFGFKTFQDAVKEQQITLELVPEMSTIYFCPYKEGEDFGCFWVKTTGRSHEIQGISKVDSNVLCPSPRIGFRTHSCRMSKLSNPRTNNSL
ncbi:hypothetical protein [Scytonema millei]|uniref:Polynucleotide kinase n=1 Tax=Scytonema millei VB511283 TaxID=1245923 RepID=A0A9X5E3D7_9CYAN|nr:hypothetical protein [Scytonema millei]NHC34431.1 hypothetical protein [Scytonema millei VB511283]